MIDEKCWSKTKKRNLTNEDGKTSMNEDVSPIKHGEFSHVICYSTFQEGKSVGHSRHSNKKQDKNIQWNPSETLSKHGGDTWVAKSGRKAFSGKSNFPALAPPRGNWWFSAPKMSTAKASFFRCWIGRVFLGAEKTIGKWHVFPHLHLLFTAVESTSTKETATWNRSLSMIWVIPIKPSTGAYPCDKVTPFPTPPVRFRARTEAFRAMTFRASCATPGPPSTVM